MKTVAEHQVEHVKALCERQKGLHSMMSSTGFILISVEEVEGALAEGEQAAIDEELEAEAQDTL